MQWGQSDVVAWLRQRHPKWVHLVQLLESHPELYVDGFVLIHFPDEVQLLNLIRDCHRDRPFRATQELYSDLGLLASTLRVLREMAMARMVDRPPQ
eukprot:m51a1_g6587 hypothetical protein (96) ;mRNA; r:237469-237756